MSIIAKIEKRRMPTNPTPLVMVIDDDEDIRNSLSEILTKMDFDVTVAPHGFDALAQLHAGVRPAVILLDLMMPEMDGFSFVVEVRKVPAFAKIPILVCTAAGSAQAEAGKIMADGYLQKPFKREDLVASITEALK